MPEQAASTFYHGSQGADFSWLPWMELDKQSHCWDLVTTVYNMEHACWSLNMIFFEGPCPIPLPSECFHSLPTLKLWPAPLSVPLLVTHELFLFLLPDLTLLTSHSSCLELQLGELEPHQATLVLVWTFCWVEIDSHLYVYSKDFILKRKGIRAFTLLPLFKMSGSQVFILLESR